MSEEPKPLSAEEIKKIAEQYENRTIGARDQIPRFLATIAQLDETIRELRKDKQRLWDLARYQRGELLDENLISEDEHAALVEDNAAIARLETYDQLRQQVATLQTHAKESNAALIAALDAKDEQVATLQKENANLKAVVTGKRNQSYLQMQSDQIAKLQEENDGLKTKMCILAAEVDSDRVQITKLREALTKISEACDMQRLESG